MSKFKLKIIPGTLDFVLNELLKKHEDISVEGKTDSEIIFLSNEEDVDRFRDLCSVLSITVINDEGKESVSRNLFRRDWKIKSAPAGINPALAYVLCTIADLKVEDVILDPFCGAGTIAITAAKYFGVKRVLASDVSGKAIDYAVENIKAAGIKNITAFRSNVSQLKLQNDSVDKVITNLPFGIRVGDHESNLKIYKSFADRMSKIVKAGGILVLYTQEKELIQKTFDNKNFDLIDNFDVEQGGLKPRVFVYKRI